MQKGLLAQLDLLAETEKNTHFQLNEHQRCMKRAKSVKGKKSQMELDIKLRLAGTHTRSLKKNFMVTFLYLFSSINFISMKLNLF